MKKYISLACLALAFTSCDDYLDQKPQDFGSEDAYYNKIADVKMGVNDFYAYLPKLESGWGGTYSADISSDNQAGSGPNALFYEGDKRTPGMTDSQPWWFNNQRAINFFLSKVEGREEQIVGSTDLINHYVGEAYFFRAFDNYNRLRQLGDVPLLESVLPTTVPVLKEATKRQPRNMVARHIINDLDKATALLLEVAPESGRICRDAALALKARVALFEATWEKYHANTCFVPGNDKWPGKAFHPDFAWPAGSAEAEVNYFLDRAIGAADSVASHRTLDGDYAGMFNRFESPFPDNDEVILARYYAKGIITHSASAYLKGGGGCNVTRAAVQTFLMDNGLPWYANNSGFKGDQTSYEEFQGRDQRLQQSVRAAGSFITGKVDPETGKNMPDTLYYHAPNITGSGVEKATTGYELEKWCSPDKDQRNGMYVCTTANPILRAGESYLIYIEAYYERHHSLGGNCDKYWKALRSRAGVDTDYQKTINNTDLSKENDLAVWSKGVEVDPVLYNIRRERRCELIAEGMRLDDLKRWRSLDMMKNYQPEGFNLWGGPMKDMYSGLKPEQVSQAADGNYVRPLRLNTTSPAYNGYNFPKPHYLEPIPTTEFSLGMNADSTNVLYQNPGWPSMTDGVADYNYNCD